MKKMSLLLVLLCLLMLPSCKVCQHQWEDATCKAPKTCALCGAEEGNPLPHTWSEADCLKPKTCTVCQETSGKALGHTWQAATCTVAKTCAVCNAVEGDPADHILLPPNYQQGAACKDCTYTQGEPVPPAYADFPVEVITAQMGVEYDYLTACYINGHTTTGKLTWENYRVFDGDDTHEAVEGYQWHSVTVKIVFSDRDAQRYGFIAQSALDDYYWIASENGNGYTDAFTVSFYGQLYDQCLMANKQATVSPWIDGACTYTAEFAWRVPVGYDGHMILFYNAANDLGEGLKSGDSSILAFRFPE